MTSSSTKTRKNTLTSRQANVLISLLTASEPKRCADLATHLDMAFTSTHGVLLALLDRRLVSRRAGGFYAATKSGRKNSYASLTEGR